MISKEKVEMAKRELIRRKVHKAVNVRLRKQGHTDPKDGTKTVMLALESIMDRSFPEMEREINIGPRSFAEMTNKVIEMEGKRHRHAIVEKVKFTTCNALNITREQFDILIERADSLGFFKYQIKRNCYVKRD